MKKIIISIVGIALAGGLIYGGFYLYQVSRYNKIVEEISIDDIDLSSVSDGTYKGECKAVFVESEVAVTVKNHEILDISLERHKNERGKSAEKIIDAVLEKQSTDVDVVSGATNSSKVILKSIENALEK